MTHTKQPTAALALPASAAPAGPARVLRVQVAGQTLALDMQVVRELRGATPVQPMPGARDAWLGLLELRGEVLPVLDLGRLLGEAPAAADAPLVVLCQPDDAAAAAAGAGPAACALRVQALDAVMDIDPAQWRLSPWPTNAVQLLALTPTGPLPLVNLAGLLDGVLPRIAALSA